MIVELVNAVSFPDENRGVNVPKYTLPSTRYERGKPSVLLRNVRSVATDVSRGSIEGSSGQMLSIPRVCRLQRTTLLFLCAAIRGQFYDFSMDRGEKANGEYLAVACHLPAIPGESG